MSRNRENPQAYRKGPSAFSECTDMETVAVMSGTGAGAEGGFPDTPGAKEDWLEVKDREEAG